ncbi:MULTISPECIES: arginine deiminase [Cysteiniphilum]|uniref:arginine deiminase n=2 Tax=Fastidiosibacteraceae TaxID=2056687 RepID=UPI00193A5488|nr:MULTISPECIES: arginine deiminase [Cysteiniphilum]
MEKNMLCETKADSHMPNINQEIDLCIPSEIGKLRTVLLKRPGVELCNLTPDSLEELLFDDIPYLDTAQREHDEFVQLLRNNDTEVLYLEDLVSEVLTESSYKLNVISELLSVSGLKNIKITTALMEYLLQFSGKELCEKLMAGIKKNEIKITDNSLSSQSAKKEQFWLQPIPNLYFTRDPASVFGNMISLNSMYAPTRQRESTFINSVLQYHPRFSQATKIDLRMNAGSIEGGDILVLDENTLAIGISQRTSAEAIEQFAHELFFNKKYHESHKISKILAIKIPVSRAFMHLDTVLTQVDHQKMTMHRDIAHTSSIYKLSKADGQQVKCEELTGSIEVILSRELDKKMELIYCGGDDFITGSREQWSDGANTLTLRPGEVFVYQRNVITNRLLQENDITVHQIPCSELSRGRGGPRCMSMPIVRDGI